MWYPMGRRQCYVLLGNEKSDWKVEGFRLYLSMCFYSYNSSEILSPPSILVSMDTRDMPLGCSRVI